MLFRYDLEYATFRALPPDRQKPVVRKLSEFFQLLVGMVLSA